MLFSCSQPPSLSNSCLYCLLREKIILLFLVQKISVMRKPLLCCCVPPRWHDLQWVCLCQICWSAKWYRIEFGAFIRKPTSGLILRRLADNYQGGQRLSLKQQQNLPRAFPRAGLRMQNKLCKKLKAITRLATFQSSSSLTKLPSHCCFSEKIPSAK